MASHIGSILAFHTPSCGPCRPSLGSRAMKIASFNINGVKARLPALLDWLRDADTDVVVLQELKSTDDAFPRLETSRRWATRPSGTHGQKGFNGVAILAAGVAPIGQPPRALPGDPAATSTSRWIEAGRGRGARLRASTCPTEIPRARSEVRLQARLDGPPPLPRPAQLCLTRTPEMDAVTYLR